MTDDVLRIGHAGFNGGHTTWWVKRDGDEYRVLTQKGPTHPTGPKTVDWSWVERHVREFGPGEWVGDDEWDHQRSEVRQRHD